MRLVSNNGLGLPSPTFKIVVLLLHRDNNNNLSKAMVPALVHKKVAHRALSQQVHQDGDKLM